MNNKKAKNTFVNTYSKNPVSTYVPSAFEALREEFGLDPVSNRTNDKEKLAQQQENFSKKYVCPICGNSKTFIKGTNVMVCKNPECKGFEQKDADGNVIGFEVPFNELSIRGEAIASTILD